MAWKTAEWPEQLHVDRLSDLKEMAQENVFVVYPTTRDYRIRQGELCGAELSNVISRNLVVKDEEFDQKHGTNSESEIFFRPVAMIQRTLDFLSRWVCYQFRR
jgi:hypothetical protein